MAYNVRPNPVSVLGEKAANTMPMFEKHFEGTQGAGGLTSVCLKLVETIMKKRITGHKREMTLPLA